jgi:hypothetical protein
MKKVALIGNMNNNFFSIARHLKKRGYEVKVFHGNQAEHFSPKADTFDLDELSICTEVSWVYDWYFSHNNIEEVQKVLSGFDYYIGQGDEAAMAKLAGFNFDVYFPYGSDIYKFAYYKPEYGIKDKMVSYLNKKSFLKEYHFKYGTFGKYLAKAVSEAKHVFWDWANDELDKKLFGLQPKGEIHRLPMPFIYPTQYTTLNPYFSDVHWRSSIDKIRKNNRFLVLYHGRQEWKTYVNEFTNKNTHHLIIGFSKLFERIDNKEEAKLLMVEYGGDVTASKTLVKELGIEEQVIWLPKMYRKDLMYLIAQVDLCSGEFYKSYNTFGTIIEAMIMAKPVINYRNDELYLDKYPSLYPCLNAQTSDEIAERLQFAFQHPDAISTMGQECKEWVEKYFVQAPIDKLIELLPQ